MKTLSTVAALPGSFKEALKLGWKIVKEESTVNADESQRSGILLLARRGTPTQLRIPYTATAKAYQFDTPEAIEQAIAA